MSRSGDKQNESPIEEGPARVIGAVEAGQKKVKPKLLIAGNRLMRNIMIGAGVFLIILTAIGLYSNYNADSKKRQKIEFAEMIAQERKAHLNGNDKEAKKLLTDFMDKYPRRSKEQDYAINNAFVAIYRTAGDYKSAQEWQIKAMESSPKVTFTDYYNLAEVCYRNNDKVCAIKYYQKALDELNGKVRINGIDGYKYYLNARLKELKQ